MSAASSTSKKPAQSLARLAGVIPTPQQETKMNSTVPQATAGVEQAPAPKPVVLHRIRERDYLEGGGMCWTLCGDILRRPIIGAGRTKAGVARPAIMCPICEATDLLLRGGAR